MKMYRFEFHSGLSDTLKLEEQEVKETARTLLALYKEPSVKVHSGLKIVMTVYAH